MTSIVVVGLGAIGSRVAALLAERGEHSVYVIDRDVVEQKNILAQNFSEDMVGVPKADAIFASLPQELAASWRGSVAEVNARTIAPLIGSPDVLLDCTDNLQTRFVIGEYCSREGIPWIHAAAVADRGNVMPIVGAPCFSCVFAEKGDGESCEASGIDPNIASQVATLQVGLIDDVARRTASAELIHIRKGDLPQYLAVSPRRGCAVCGGVYTSLARMPAKARRICGGIYHFDCPLPFEMVRRRLDGRAVRVTDNAVYAEDIVAFADGRVHVHADSLRDAQSAFDIAFA
ncbi:MAG: ThiF family adenylyltransferase [Nanoarchaeota archaeon]